MTELVWIGIGMVLVGFLVVFLAAAISGGSKEEGRREGVRGGGVIMIGPIPIIVGSDAKWATVAIALALVLIVVALLSEVLAGR